MHTTEQRYANEYLCRIWEFDVGLVQDGKLSHVGRQQLRLALVGVSLCSFNFTPWFAPSLTVLSLTWPRTAASHYNIDLDSDSDNHAVDLHEWCFVRGRSCHYACTLCQEVHVAQKQQSRRTDDMEQWVVDIVTTDRRMQLWTVRSAGELSVIAAF